MEPTRAGPSALPAQIRLDPFHELATRRGWLHQTGRMAGDWNTSAMATDLGQFTLSGGMAHGTVNRIVTGQQKITPAFVLAVIKAAEATYGTVHTDTDYFTWETDHAPSSARTEGREAEAADRDGADTAGSRRPA